MKRHVKLFMLMAALSVAAVGCGSKRESASSSANETPSSTTVIESSTTSSTGPVTDTTIPVAIAISTETKSCRFATATQPLELAFCETFDSRQGNGGKTGDLDPTLWGVNRTGQDNLGQGQLNNIADTKLAGCGPNETLSAPNDVRICNGQLFEAQNDNHGVVNLNIYPKQPFDFAARTGTVVFDVSNDTDGTHGAWPEFVITDKPVPGVRMDVSTAVPAASPNEIGFTLAGGCVNEPDVWSVGQFFMSKNNVYSDPAFTQVSCVKKSTGVGGDLNHVEFRVNQKRAEVWATNPGGDQLQLLAYADNLDLGFTRGLVWIDDVHYNARKADPSPCMCGLQFEHTFVWDNLGFDGPKTYRDLGFDVPDVNDHDVRNDEEGLPVGSMLTGFSVNSTPITLTVNGVHSDQPPTAAQVVVSTGQFETKLPSISVNNGPWIDTPWPYDAQTFSRRALSIPVPLDQIHDGTNTISFKSDDPNTTINNVSLILVAGARVPE